MTELTLEQKIKEAFDHAVDLEQDETLDELMSEGASREKVWDKSWRLAEERVSERGFDWLNEHYDVCLLREDDAETYDRAKTFFETLC